MIRIGSRIQHVTE